MCQSSVMQMTTAEPPSSPLAKILEPRLNVVTFERSLTAEMRAVLEEVAAAEPFRRQLQLDAGLVDPTPLLTAVKVREAREFLAQDIAALVREYGRALSRRHVHAKLAVLHDDGCRKLHTDNVTVRLLCTYAGPGTEWVPDADAVRENVGRTDVDIATANRSVLREPGVVRTVNAGDVILLKGDGYPGFRGRGAVHRSPPIADDGLRRLVLTLDEHPCGC